MPKMKTHKATSKRYKITGTGKVLRMKVSKGHLCYHKPKRVRRRFDKYIKVTHKGTIRRIRRSAPALWK
nr:50S ribosomal protein L35 [Ardenticatena sp.]